MHLKGENLDEALDYLKKAVDTLRADHHNRHDLHSRALLARAALSRDRGDLAGAAEDIRDALALAVRTEMPIAELEAEIESARLLLAQSSADPSDAATERSVRALDHLEHARQLIDTTRAFRRSSEVKTLWRSLTGQAEPDAYGFDEDTPQTVAETPEASEDRGGDSFRTRIRAAPQQVDAYYNLLRQLFDEAIIPKREFMHGVCEVYPFGLIVVSDEHGEVLGGAELYGFKDAFWELYRAGKATDADFSVDNLLTYEELITARRFYCAITLDEQRYIDPLARRWDPFGRRRLRDHLLILMTDMIERLYFKLPNSTEVVDIFAIGASRGGLHLARSLKFRQIDDGKGRSDGSPFGRLRVGPGDAARACERLVPSHADLRAEMKITLVGRTAVEIWSGQSAARRPPTAA